MKKLIFAVTTLLLSLNLTAQIDDFSFYDGENYQLAEFKFWNPNLNDDYKGILVLTPGINRDGREAVLDTVWQKFATKHNLIIVASHFLKIMNLIIICATEMLQKAVEIFY